jgi:hypothetical protein
VLVLIVVREEAFHQAGDEAQQSNSARRCRRFDLHNVIFSIPNSAVGGFLLRLDFSKSNALFDFGNFRFLPGQLVVTGLARSVAFGQWERRSMAGNPALAAGEVDFVMGSSYSRKAPAEFSAGACDYGASLW